MRFHEAASHEELHGQIVYLAVGAARFLDCKQSAHDLANDDGACLKHLIVGRGFAVTAKCAQSLSSIALRTSSREIWLVNILGNS